MIDRNRAVLALATAGVLTSGMAQAALHDRGGGLLYDDKLNLTWLQDANYVKTSGLDADGLMKWSEANTWASKLNISRIADESLKGWRLAANTPVKGNFWNYTPSYDGSTDQSFNITNQHSELSYMYYVNLGLKGYRSPSGDIQPDFGIFRNGKEGGQANVGLVENLQSHVYWSGTASPDSANHAWFFTTQTGYQNYSDQGHEFYAWAVRPGDVADVSTAPEPETYAMILAGLGLLGGVARRRKHK